MREGTIPTKERQKSYSNLGLLGLLGHAPTGHSHARATAAAVAQRRALRADRVVLLRIDGGRLQQGSSEARHAPRKYGRVQIQLLQGGRHLLSTGVC